MSDFSMNSITGLTAIVRSNCSEPEPSIATNLAWSDYVNPCALLLLYFYFAFETNRTLFHRVNSFFSLHSFVLDLIDDFFRIEGSIEFDNDTIH